MKLINQSFEIITQTSGIDGVYKHIEKAGRTCYKSEDKITEDSAKKFVDMLTNAKHGAMLEHGTVYLYIEFTSPLTDKNFLRYSKIKHKYSLNKYSKVVNKLIDNYKTQCYITTNYRVLVENNWLDDLQYMCEPTEHHAKRVTVKFTTDNGIMREFTRHRVMSFACESTRYCNYSKNKFGNNITYVIPNWIALDEQIINSRLEGNNTIEHFINGLLDAENAYFTLLQEGWKPQQARNVLPLATKCDLVMTGFVEDWSGFFELRCSTAAHPQAKELADNLKQEFIKLSIYEG